jgi:HAD superfamily hydrolase (TIGR01509 family)
MSTPHFEAVLFDCDGVLADSEAITNAVLRDMLIADGWQISMTECMQIFVGKAVRDEAALIEQRTGKPLTEAWLARFRDLRNEALTHRVQAIPNIQAAVHDIHTAHAGQIACASGADRFKVELMLRKLDLLSYFDGRIFSGHDMPRSKPYPDVYLAAAQAVAAHPKSCAVVEDTPTGIRAGVAAGATVFAYSPASTGHFSAADLREAGAHHVFTDMAHLPELLRIGPAIKA